MIPINALAKHGSYLVAQKSFFASRPNFGPSFCSLWNLKIVSVDRNARVTRSLSTNQQPPNSIPKRSPPHEAEDAHNSVINPTSTKKEQSLATPNTPKDSTEHSSHDTHPHKDNNNNNNNNSTNMSSESSHTHSHSEAHEAHGEEDHSHSHSAGSLFTHSHSHSHQSNEILLAAQKDGFFKNPAVRITWIGLLVNVGMAASKGIGGVYFHSQSLLADAVHSVSDMVADFLTLATVNVSSKIGTPTRFPLGYGKIETVGSVLVSGVLLFAGISVGWSSLLQIFEYTLPAYLYDYAAMIQIGHSHSHGVIGDAEPAGHAHSHGHSHSHMSSTDVGAEAFPEAATTLSTTGPQTPAIAGAWLAGGSILVKEFLFRKTLKVAEQTNSKVLVANAWHHRVDSLTSMVAFFTITGSYLFNVAWLDSIGGLFVSILIIRTGWSTFLSSWYELVDRGEPPESEIYLKIKKIAQTEVNRVSSDSFDITKLSIISSGPTSNIYMTLVQNNSKDYSLREINSFETKIVEAIKEDDKFIKNIFILFKSKK